ncbi:HDOD domain-containing protein [Thermopirellula anaerolimosa]
MSVVAQTSGFAGEKAVRAAQRVHEISTLPQVALNIIRVADDPNSSAADLKSVMEADAALSARVIRCVNSSAYGLRSKITNLQQAIAYLGLKQIRNLAVTATVSDLFKAGDGVGPYRRTELWRHLVGVGLCARMLAMRLRISNFEDVFLAGLLHDIGIILIDQHYHSQFVRIIESLQESVTLCEVETQVLGFSHVELGAALAEQWSFPISATAAIRYHHQAAAYRGEHIALIRCVEVANLICTLKGMPSVGMNLLRFNPQSVAALGLTATDLKVLAADLDDELSAQSGLFQI